MGDYRLSKAAANDLLSIARYTVETHGVVQARKYRDALLDACTFLSENPEAARLRTELEPPMRVHRHLSHMLLYTIRENDILIVRIRHVREDWASSPEGEAQ